MEVIGKDNQRRMKRWSVGRRPTHAICAGRFVDNSIGPAQQTPGRGPFSRLRPLIGPIFEGQKRVDIIRSPRLRGMAVN
jgi:hypothetical protein